jgi:hypothetical protein
MLDDAKNVLFLLLVLSSFLPSSSFTPQPFAWFRRSGVRRTFIARKVSCLPFDSQSMTTMRDWKFHLVMHQEIAGNKKAKKILHFLSSLLSCYAKHGRIYERGKLNLSPSVLEVR